MRFAFGVLVGYLLWGCAAALTPAQQADVANEAAQIAACQTAGETCKASGGTNCYAVYDACMARAGLRDGGPDA